MIPDMGIVASAQQNFCHYVAFVAVVFEIVLGSEIIKADCFGLGLVKFAFGVTVYDFVAVLDEFETYFSARFDAEFKFDGC